MLEQGTNLDKGEWLDCLSKEPAWKVHGKEIWGRGMRMRQVYGCGHKVHISLYFTLMLTGELPLQREHSTTR